MSLTSRRAASGKGSRNSHHNHQTYNNRTSTKHTHTHTHTQITVYNHIIYYIIRISIRENIQFYILLRRMEVPLVCYTPNKKGIQCLLT